MSQTKKGAKKFATSSRYSVIASQSNQDDMSQNRSIENVDLNKTADQSFNYNERLPQFGNENLRQVVNEEQKSQNAQKTMVLEYVSSLMRHSLKEITENTEESLEYLRPRASRILAPKPNELTLADTLKVLKTQQSEMINITAGDGEENEDLQPLIRS